MTSILPIGVGNSILGQSTSLFGSFSGIFTMILGLMVFFFVARVIIEIMARRRDSIYFEQLDTEKDISHFGYTKSQAKDIYKNIKSNKSAKKAIQMRQNFEQVIAGKDSISVNTK